MFEAPQESFATRAGALSDAGTWILDRCSRQQVLRLTTLKRPLPAPTCLPEQWTLHRLPACSCMYLNNSPPAGHCLLQVMQQDSGLPGHRFNKRNQKGSCRASPASAAALKLSSEHANP